MNQFDKNIYLAQRDKDVYFYFSIGKITWEQALTWLATKKRNIFSEKERRVE